MMSDVPEAFWVAELAREQLFRTMREELPHSIHTRVTEWEWPRIRCDILVERDSRRGWSSANGALSSRRSASRVRRQLPPSAYLELMAKIDRDWQRRPSASIAPRSSGGIEP